MLVLSWEFDSGFGIFILNVGVYLLIWGFLIWDLCSVFECGFCLGVVLLDLGF